MHRQKYMPFSNIYMRKYKDIYICILKEIFIFVYKKKKEEEVIEEKEGE